METKPSNTTAKVRAWLRTELAAWVNEGLLSSDAARALTVRYGLDRPERSASQLLVAVVLAIGGLLIGGGIMALVAANWDVIPANAKLAGLLVLLLGLHATGFRMLSAGRRRLGQWLVLVACVCFGGGIGLVAQVFHITSEAGMGFFLWAVGALATAWAALGVPAAMLSLGIGAYWYLADGHSLRLYPEWSVLATPFLMLLLYGLLALASRSRALMVSCAGLFCFILAGALASVCTSVDEYAAMAGAGTGGFLLWSMSQWIATSGRCARHQGVLRTTGVTAMAIAAYVTSYRWGYEHGDVARDPGNVELTFTVLGTLLAAALFQVVAWLPAGVEARRRRTARFVLVGFGCFLVAVLMPRVIGHGYALMWIILANVAVLLFSAAAIASGFGEASRAYFWAGTLLAVTLIISRFLEYNTNLVAKGAAFIACGVLMIYAGIEYERWLKKRSARTDGAP